MIRKDFILQNYVGTGGKCDARAVRCHERIARWHAMCEHQLSHINEFVVQQVCRLPTRAMFFNRSESID
jgi:SAC3/GANP family